jgi:hypothetical protein
MRVFAIPALIALLSTAGLVSALTGDGLPDLVSWALLFIPIAAAARGWTRRT